MADDNGTMRVAEDDLGTHVDKLIDEKQTTLEHLLMEEYASPCLGGYDDQYGQQVWCQSWPRGICQCHDGAVDE